MKMKKAMTQQKIVVIILTILILAVILWWLFGANIQNWIRNLPGYSVPKEDVEINLANQSDIVLGTQCKNIIGRGTNPIILDGKITNLYLNLEKVPTIQIFVTKKFLGIDKLSSDVQIGEFEQWKEIKIFQWVLDGTGDYSKIKDIIPDNTELTKLNGAYYIKGVSGDPSTDFICKDEVVSDVNSALGTKKDPYIGFEKNNQSAAGHQLLPCPPKTILIEPA